MPQPSTLVAIVHITPVGPRWRVVFKNEELVGDLSLHQAQEAAERVKATLLERGFQFVRIKTERKKKGRWG